MQCISSATNHERAATFFPSVFVWAFLRSNKGQEKFTAHSVFLNAIDHDHSINDTQFPQRYTYHSKQFHTVISDIPTCFKNGYR
jgi:hypothetical protein